MELMPAGLYTMNQGVCHLVGDYVLQSDWMATTKTKKSIATLAHVLTYTLPFLLLTQSWKALLVIAGTHFVIDRWRLARYVVWAKNYLAPREVCNDCGGNSHVRHLKWSNPPWSDVKDSFGYPKDRPVWLAMWLMIIADNLMHVIINGLALRYL
jgi:Protein of unknown function (DUF3307)